MYFYLEDSHRRGKNDKLKEIPKYATLGLRLQDKVPIYRHQKLTADLIIVNLAKT